MPSVKQEVAILELMDLPSRIREVAQDVGGLNRLADRTGIPRRTLGSWLEGRKPKPEALQKIADAAEVNLAWLVSGIGGKYTRERLAREADEAQRAAKFEDSFGRGVRAFDQRLRAEDPFYDLEIGARAPRLDIVLLERLARLASDVHKEAGIRIAPEKVSAVAGELYNELVARVTNIGDTDEVDATLPQLRFRLEKRLAKAVSEPGTGKREAS